MDKKNKSTRRGFLKSTLAIGAGITIVPRNVLGGNGFIAPSDQLSKAIIGVGGMGRGHEWLQALYGPGDEGCPARISLIASQIDQVVR